VNTPAESNEVFKVVQEWIPTVNSVWKQCCVEVFAEKHPRDMAENPLSDQDVSDEEYTDLAAWSTYSADKVPTIAFKGGRRFKVGKQRKINAATIVNKDTPPRGVIFLAMDRANAISLAHEIGHALGQREEDEDRDNLMWGTRKTRRGVELRWKLHNNLKGKFDQCELFRGSNYAK